MSRIQTLPNIVIDQIAAGEVIERPSSVIKELIENALDAAPTQITVEVNEGGRTLLRVTDNGFGMDKTDLRKCLERFATSKIKETEDLDRIASYGFRGEALPSIASVSHLIIQSRGDGEPEAFEIKATGNQIADLIPIALEKGTKVSVEHLFFNVPARLKFLKNDSTEIKKITQCVEAFALVKPEIGFKLIANKKVIRDTSARASLADRFLEIYGAEFMKQCCLLNSTFQNGAIQGMISEPSNTRRDRSGIKTFVNGRLVQNSILNFVISKFYKDKIPHSFYPTVTVLLQLNPTLVDVNVHPAKLEVRFRNEGEIITACLKVFSMALERKLVDTIHTSAPFSPSTGKFGSAERTSLETLGNSTPVPSSINNVLQQLYELPFSKPETRPLSFSESSPVYTPPQMTFVPGTNLQCIGQIKNRYLVVQMDDAIAIVDQHAAHERVNYERMLKLKAQHAAYSQPLLVPQTLLLPPEDYHFLENNWNAVNESGFVVSAFGKNTVKLDAVPPGIDSKNAAEYFKQLLAFVKDSSREDPAMDRWIRGVCRKSVMFGDPLTPEEQSQLIHDLFLHCQSPYSCPHGRPTFFKLSWNEIDRKLGRV
jgi:DNA mismatch repair protein MutL